MNICSRSKQHSHRKLMTIIVMTPTARLLIMTNVTSVTKNENLIHEVVYKIQENISNDVSLLKNKHVAEKCCTAAGFLPCTVLCPVFFFCPGPISLGPYENKTKTICKLRARNDVYVSFLTNGQQVKTFMSTEIKSRKLPTGRREDFPSSCLARLTC